MTESSLIQLYLKDANEVIANINKNLDLNERAHLDMNAGVDSEQKTDGVENKNEQIVTECIQDIRYLTMICWMAGKDEKDINLDFLSQLVQIHDLSFTRIFNYITRTTAEGKLIVEFLKLFEIMIRNNTRILKKFMGEEKNLSDKLQNLLNQTIHPNEDQMIRRWVLKIIYIYQINKAEFKTFSTLDYASKRSDYKKAYNFPDDV